MSAPLRYVGPYPPTNTASVLPKAQADAMFSTLEVTNATVTAQVNAYLVDHPVAPVSYFITQNALIAQQSAVNAADATYALASSLNAASGVAGLDVNGNLLSAQVLSSNVITNRVAKFYSVGQVSGSEGILGGTTNTTPGATGVILINGSYEVTSTGPPYSQLAALSVPDPGWPWLPVCSGLIMGDSSATKPAPFTRSQGTGNAGAVLVTPYSSPSTIYGYALCADSYYTDTYPIQPYAAMGQSPTTVPPIIGPMEFAVWGTAWNSAPYVFYEQNLMFGLLQVPAM
jgi:hypothetical protein